MHLNIVQGDFIFYAWKDNEEERLELKQQEIEGLGYKLIEEEYDYLNCYMTYRNSEGEEKVITICMN